MAFQWLIPTSFRSYKEGTEYATKHLSTKIAEIMQTLGQEADTPNEWRDLTTKLLLALEELLTELPYFLFAPEIGLGSMEAGKLPTQKCEFASLQASLYILTLLIALNPDNEVLRQRADRMVDKMFAIITKQSERR